MNLPSSCSERHLYGKVRLGLHELDTMEPTDGKGMEFLATFSAVSPTVF